MRLLAPKNRYLSRIGGILWVLLDRIAMLGLLRSRVAGPLAGPVLARSSAICLIPRPHRRRVSWPRIEIPPPSTSPASGQSFDMVERDLGAVLRDQIGDRGCPDMAAGAEDFHRLGATSSRSIGQAYLEVPGVYVGEVWEHQSNAATSNRTKWAAKILPASWALVIGLPIISALHRSGTDNSPAPDRASSIP